MEERDEDEGGGGNDIFMSVQGDYIRHLDYAKDCISSLTLGK